MKPDDAGEPGAPSTRERLVEAARQLFLIRGYEATGIAEILREAGVNSGSLYYFFRTKEALLLAVLESYTELLHPVVIEPACRQVSDPMARVFAVLARYREMLVATGCARGCPIGNLAIEMSEKSEAARQKIAANFEAWRAAIRGFLDGAGERLPADTDRDRLATFVLTVLEGGIMQARAHRSIEPFDASAAMLRDYFDRLILGAESEAAPPATARQSPDRRRNR
jgi:TetR/AcrR family transcriptional repressor of nem operon